MQQPIQIDTSHLARKSTNPSVHRLQTIGESVAWLFAFVAEKIAVAAILALAVILFAGVVSRYAFSSPLTWTDEVTSILFPWLTMSGSVVACARDGHLRLSVVDRRLSTGNNQATIKSISALLTLIFLICMTVLSAHHLDEASYLTTPTLNISESWRAMAMVVGFALMAILAAHTLINTGLRNPRSFLWSVVLLALASIPVALISKATGGHYDLAIFFVGLGGACVLIGVPIAFSFGLSALAFLVWTSSIPLSIVVSRFESGMSHLALLSVPMFILLGLLFEMTGMARSMISFLVTLVGHWRGGLSYVMLAAMYLVSGISGAKAADMAAVAPAMVPEMRRRRVPDSELVALLAASSAMSETIPPSLVLITVGVVSGVSIGALFTGGLLPAAVLALLMCIVARYYAGKDGVTNAQRATWTMTFQASFGAIPGLLLPVVIRTAVVEGIATATEVATIGVLFIMIVAIVIYRQFDLRRFYAALKDTASLTGAIMIILGGANAVSWALTQTGFSQDLARTITSLPGGAFSFMAISILVFICFGSLLEGIPALVIFGPLLFPIARSLGIHEVQYAMVAVLAMGVGLYMPPFGVGYYMACAISRIDPDVGMVRIWPYLLVLIFGIAIVATVPWISIGFLHK